MIHSLSDTSSSINQKPHSGHLHTPYLASYFIDSINITDRGPL